MRVTSKLLALALAAALQPAVAAPVQLDFEDINGTSGPGHDGFAPLTTQYESSKGVVFSGDAWGVASAFAGNHCSGHYRYASGDTGCGAIVVAGDPRDGARSGDKSVKIDFVQGFIQGSSLDFSDRDGSLSIDVFADVAGTELLASFGNLDHSICGTSGFRFCSWNSLRLDFADVAHSLVIHGTDENVMIDNLSLVTTTAASAPGTLPEPASVALALGALGALGWARKRTAR